MLPLKISKYALVVLASLRNAILLEADVVLEFPKSKTIPLLCIVVPVNFKIAINENPTDKHFIGIPFKFDKDCELDALKKTCELLVGKPLPDEK